jgi:hypothetical protein
MLATGDINFKIKNQIMLQVQGFDYQHSSGSQKIVSVKCMAKMVNSKIYSISTLHEGQKPILVQCFPYLCDCKDRVQTHKAS